MVLEILYFDGCPSFDRLLPRVQALAAGRAEIALRRIDSTEDAQGAHFLGSPTVRVDGVDVEPGADARTDFGMKCRLYRSSEGQAHTPPEVWIRAALAS